MNDWLRHGFEFGSAVELAAVLTLAATAAIILFGTPEHIRERLSQWESRPLRPVLWLARRPALSVLVCGVAPMLLRAALWPLLRYPVPGALDEYSYLLAADTFAHGRLTNPTHPLWQFFETFHVIQTPSYASKYPPLQGLLLAAGQVLLGHPWWGVYVSVGIMSATLCWALRGWVPGRWALLGSFVALLQWEVLSYWMNSYWGGALAATGAALLLGGFPRLPQSLRRRSPWIALLMAVGVAILANTRPYEGLMLAAPLLIAVAWRILRRGSRVSVRALLPATLVLLATASAMMYYCWRVTGDPLLMPYVVHERQYAISPSFILLPPRLEPVSRHPIMAQWWRQERDSYDMARSTRFPRYILNHAYMVFIFFIGPALLMAYAALCLRATGMKIRWLVGLLLLQFLAIVMVAGNMPHYAAPSTALVLLLAVIGVRRLHTQPRWGPALVHAIVLACVVRAVMCLPAYYWIPASHRDMSDYYRRCCIDNNANFDRASLQERLEGLPGRQLVIVQYTPAQPRFKEYVYNLADIDSQRVVWARSMGAAENIRLLNYYGDRHVWLLTIFSDHGEFRPYPIANASLVP